MMRLEGKNGSPIVTMQDWFEFAPPMGGSLQWRDGRSAKELARAWCGRGEGPVPPVELLNLLATNTLFQLLAFDESVGFPEHRVRFDRARGEPRNSDLCLTGWCLDGPIAISVEAKADESFGRTVGEEIINAAAQWAFAEQRGKLERIERLVEAVLPRRSAGQVEVGQLRYQLLTAVAGAWAFAGKAEASRAVLVIHEFVGPDADSSRVEANRKDLDQFINRVTRGADQALGYNDLVGPLPVPENPLWLGVEEWYIGKCRTELNHVQPLPLIM